jgi:carbon-monoxide dehydrogenase small subunit
LHPIQEAFAKHHAFQCGYCTPGMILNAYALLLKRPRPARAEILREMEDNLCRCGAHTRIVDAIEEASAAMYGGAR